MMSEKSEGALLSDVYARQLLISQINSQETYEEIDKNFDKIILSSYGWQVPYKTANDEHGVASLAPKANSFEWVSETDNDQRKAIWPPKEDEIISILIPLGV